MSTVARDDTEASRPVPLVLSERTHAAIEKYTQLKLAMELVGEMTKEEWEHARSYAAEAIFNLLMDNATVFRLKADMQPILDARKRP